MRILVLILLSATQTTQPEPCKIYGRVQVVQAFADYKVQTVQSGEDLQVSLVNSFPNQPGRWKIVDSNPDFTIQFVQAFPDFKVRMVSRPKCK